MSRLVVPLAAATLIAACATEPSKTAADEQRCSPSDPPTGSMVVRGARCVVTTDAERDAQRRALEQMRQQQEMQRRPVGGGG
jgi:uncharacterized lipoprotein YajG